jgi:maleate cis-trans isomerase
MSRHERGNAGSVPMPVEVFGSCLRQGAGQRCVQQPRLSKPLIVLNTATYWHPLRQCGLDGKVQSFGRLLAKF